MRQDRVLKPLLLLSACVVVWLAFSLGRIYERTEQRRVKHIKAAVADKTAELIEEGDISPPDEAMGAPGRLRIATTPYCMDAPFEYKLSSWNCHVEETDSPQIWRLLAGQLYNTREKRCLSAEQSSNRIRMHECHTDLSKIKFQRRGRRSPLVQMVFPAKSTPERQLCLTAVVDNISTNTLPTQFGYKLKPCSSEGEQLCKQLILNNALGLEHDKAEQDIIFHHDPLAWIPPPALAPQPEKPVRILCWVMAHPGKLLTRARGINSTWGQQCDSLLFATISDTRHLGLDWLPLSIPEEPDRRSYLWFKSQQAWQKLYQSSINDYDYFIRADDDAYLHMHNLKLYLAQRNADVPEYFGRLYNAAGDLYYSGGSGTILSRGALKLLGKALVDKSPDIFSPHPTFADDLELGVSMLKLGVVAKPWLDDKGRHLFLGLGLEEERTLKRDVDSGHWLMEYDKQFKGGSECCSTRWLGTHYVDWEALYYYHDLAELGCEAAGLPAWWVAADGR
eukprot:TRINITY_DN9148_c0_g1_i1.p1 TRINITY_DN9148_c0_g1~~TRINITY_DN9148_c0_g1_i1.p1  ORF type:complete len:506 (+),score=92.62 TRINITY_DN9148_c0_g1_i1:47-1564(+)